MLINSHVGELWETQTQWVLYAFVFRYRCYRKCINYTGFDVFFYQNNKPKHSGDVSFFILITCWSFFFFFPLCEREVLVCKNTARLLSARGPLTTSVCWHFSPAISPTLLIAEKNLDSTQKEIKRSQCTKFKELYQLFLALLIFLFLVYLLVYVLLEVCINYSQYTKYIYIQLLFRENCLCGFP